MGIGHIRPSVEAVEAVVSAYPDKPLRVLDDPGDLARGQVAEIISDEGGNPYERNEGQNYRKDDSCVAHDAVRFVTSAKVTFYFDFTKKRNSYGLVWKCICLSCLMG